MIDSMFAFAPAGVLGAGSVDARPWGGVAVASAGLLHPVAAIAGVRGSGVPSARSRAGVRGACTSPAGAEQPTYGITNVTAQNDGTTLGICSSRRPPQS